MYHLRVDMKLFCPSLVSPNYISSSNFLIINAISAKLPTRVPLEENRIIPQNRINSHEEELKEN
jgi:hypothetical protein